MLGLKYITFLYKSTNEHGVHSPFVYDFLTKGIYTTEGSKTTIKGQQKPGKGEQIYTKIASYFKFKSVFPTKPSQENDSYDAVILNFKTPLDFHLKLGNNTTCFILFDPNNILNKSLWKQMQSHPMLHVTIDLFYIGIAFKRPQQKKEHFVLAPYKTLTAFIFEKIKF